MGTKTATRLKVEITEVGPRSFGYNGRARGMVVRLSGHPTIEGREVVRFNGVCREICETCHGSGFRPEYAGIFGGQCFYCTATGLGAVFGKGSALELARKLRNRAQATERREAKRAAEVERKNAERAIGHEVWKAANSHLAGIVAEYGRFVACEHWSLTSGPCYREVCEEARRDAEEIYYPELIHTAYTAMWRALDTQETARLAELAAMQEERTAKRLAAQERTAAKRWIGAEGAKVTVTGTLAKPFHLESTFGYRTTTSTLYKLTTPDGDVVTWFRTGFHTFEAGETVTLTGTVKALKETEKYGKETQLTRCKIS